MTSGCAVSYYPTYQMERPTRIERTKGLNKDLPREDIKIEKSPDETIRASHFSFYYHPVGEVSYVLETSYSRIKPTPADIFKSAAFKIVSGKESLELGGQITTVEGMKIAINGKKGVDSDLFSGNFDIINKKQTGIRQFTVEGETFKVSELGLSPEQNQELAEWMTNWYDEILNVAEILIAHGHMLYQTEEN